MNRAGIKTLFRGTLYRSRTEAKWAAFLYNAGVVAKYEPGRFQVGNAGSYLADFHLPDLGAWIECKPAEKFKIETLRKARAMSDYMPTAHNDHGVTRDDKFFWLVGQPRTITVNRSPVDVGYLLTTIDERRHVFGECQACQQVAIYPYGEAAQCCKLCRRSSCVNALSVRIIVALNGAYRCKFA